MAGGGGRWVAGWWEETSRGRGERLRCLACFANSVALTLRDLSGAYNRHQNDYMQLFLLSGINFLKITITISFFNP